MEERMPIIAHEHYCAICDDKWICGMPECPLPDDTLCSRCRTPSKGMQRIQAERDALLAACEALIDEAGAEVHAHDILRISGDAILQCRDAVAHVQVPGDCHCGKHGHALGSINCPVHGVAR